MGCGQRTTDLARVEKPTTPATTRPRTRAAANHGPRTTDHGPRARRPKARRGVTLIEMLVTVAIMVLIMAVVAQVFRAATGAVSTAQAIQDLDGQLRRVESVIRSDLGGATARFTPPLDPGSFGPGGYFEVRRERVCRQPGRGQRRLYQVHRQGARRPAVHGAHVRAAANTDRPDECRSAQQLLEHPANHDHQRIRRDHLLPAQWQSLSPRAPGRTRTPEHDPGGTPTRQLINKQDPTVNNQPYASFNPNADPMTPMPLSACR